MKADLYWSVVSKLATIVPLFAKAIMDGALEKNGLTPSTVTPVQMMRIIRDEIQPRVRRFTRRDDALMMLGAGQVVTDTEGRLVRMDSLARMLLGITDGSATDERLREIGLERGSPSYARPRVLEVALESSHRTLNVAAAPLVGDDGSPGGCLAILQDVTLRVALEREVERYEEELRLKSEQLEIASHHRDEFLARMSHELRTPLHCIIGYTELTLRDEGSVSEPSVQQNLRTTMTCAQDLLGLINDMFDMTAISSGKLVMRPEDVDVADLVAECIEIVRPLMGGKAVQLRAILPPSPIVVRTDRLRLKQILLNLLGNGIKFTERGEVVAEVAPQGGDRAVVRVSDTGIGIAEDQMDHIFEPFYQVDGSERRKHGGAGLGLALVWHLAAGIGGTVSATSRPGEGSTFSVEIPRGRISSSSRRA